MAKKDKIRVAYDIEKAHPSTTHLDLFNNCKNVWKTDLGLFFEHSKETETFAYSNVEVEIITLEEYDSCAQEKENALKNNNNNNESESGEDSNLNKCPAGMYQCHFCPKFYETHHSLKRHVDTHHPAQFAQLYPTKRRPTIYRCHVCYRGFDRRSYVGEHIAKFHPDIHSKRKISININTNNSTSCNNAAPIDNLGTTATVFKDANESIKSNTILGKSCAITTTTSNSNNKNNGNCSKETNSNKDYSDTTNNYETNATFSNNKTKYSSSSNLDHSMITDNNNNNNSNNRTKSKNNNNIQATNIVLKKDDGCKVRNNTDTIDVNFNKSCQVRKNTDTIELNLDKIVISCKKIVDVSSSPPAVQHQGQGSDGKKPANERILDAHLLIRNNTEKDSTPSTKPMATESVSFNKNESGMENLSSAVSRTRTSKVKKGRYWKDFIEIICIDGRKTFKCKKCSFVSKWKRSARRHIQVHFSPSFSCEECGMQIRSRDALRKHIKYCCLWDQELKCNYCMRVFSTRSALTRHLKMKRCHPGVGNVGNIVLKKNTDTIDVNFNKSCQVRKNTGTIELNLDKSVISCKKIGDVSSSPPDVQHQGQGSDGKKTADERILDAHLLMRNNAEKDIEVVEVIDVENQLLFMDELEKLSIENESVENGEDKIKSIHNKIEGKSSKEKARKNKIVLNECTTSKKSSANRIQLRGAKKYCYRTAARSNMDLRKQLGKVRKPGGKRKTRFWFPSTVMEEENQLVSKSSKDCPDKTLQNEDKDNDVNEDGNDAENSSTCNTNNCNSSMLTKITEGVASSSSEKSEASRDATTAKQCQMKGQIKEDENRPPENQLFFMDELENMTEVGNKMSKSGKDCNNEKISNYGNLSEYSSIESERTNQDSCIRRKSNRIRRKTKKLESGHDYCLPREGKSKTISCNDVSTITKTSLTSISECQLCSKSYRTPGHLKKHVEMHHPDHFPCLYEVEKKGEVFRCHICWEEFDEKSSVAKHIAVSHLDTKWSRNADTSDKTTNNVAIRKKENHCMITDSHNKNSCSASYEGSDSSNYESIRGCKEDESIDNNIGNKKKSIDHRNNNIDGEINNSDGDHSTSRANVATIEPAEANCNDDDIDFVCTRIYTNDVQSSSTKCDSTDDLLFSDELEIIEKDEKENKTWEDSKSVSTIPKKEKKNKNNTDEEIKRVSKSPMKSGKNSTNYQTRVNSCQLCPKYYTSSGYLKKHVEMHHPDHFPRLYEIEKKTNLFRCHICWEEFDEKSRVGKHILESHSHTKRARNIDTSNDINNRACVKNAITSCSTKDTIDDDTGIGSSSSSSSGADQTNESTSRKCELLKCSLCMEGFHVESSLRLHVLSQHCKPLKVSMVNIERARKMCCPFQKPSKEILGRRNSPEQQRPDDAVDHKRCEDSSSVHLQQRTIQDFAENSKRTNSKENNEIVDPLNSDIVEEMRSNIFETLSDYKTVSFTSSHKVNNNETSTMSMSEPDSSKGSMGEDLAANVPITFSKALKNGNWKDLPNVEIISIDGVQAFKCKLCPFASKWKNVTSNHLRTHSPPRASSCNECGKQTHRSDHLCRHARSKKLKDVLKSTKKRCMKCDDCMKVFPDSWKLLRHLQNKVSCIKTKCDKCERVFSSPSELRQHIRRKVCPSL